MKINDVQSAALHKAKLFIITIKQQMSTTAAAARN